MKINTYTQMIVELLNNSKDNKENFLTSLTFLSNILQVQSSVPFSWCGTKIKMDNELNEVFDFLHSEKIKKTNCGYDTIVDIFGGAGNSMLVLEDSLKVSGVKNFILNDINPVIYQTHLDYKENPNELRNEFSEIIRTKFIKRYGTIFLEKKKFEEVIAILVDELKNLEDKKQYSSSSSILFIILRDLAYSGAINFHSDGTFKFSKKIYDLKRYFPWFFRQLNRISYFSKIYNDLDIQIYNLDCFELLEMKGIKGNPNALINLDPPYIKQTTKNYAFEELEHLTSKELKDCDIDYNQKFPHIELLKLLPNYNFIYNNNSHPIVNFYANKINSNSKPFNRKEVMTSKKDKEVKIVEETILFKNSII